MRSVIIGAVESTAVTLTALVEEGSPPVALMTLPLELRQRHSNFVDLRDLADRFGIPVIETQNVNDDDSLAQLRNLRPDVVWVVGWSQICGPDFLRIPSIGCIGFHPARLPENRGRAVIPWTILQDAQVTGASLFWLGSGVDDGDIIFQETFEVAPNETAASLIGKHAGALNRMVRAVLAIQDPHAIPANSQDHSLATYCARRTADDGEIDWHLPAREIWRFIRAVGDPYPGAFSFIGDQQVVIWAAEYAGPLPIWGQAGQVVREDNGSILVQCGDREHLRVRREDLQIDAPTVLVRVGQKFVSSCGRGRQ